METTTAAAGSVLTKKQARAFRVDTHDKAGHPVTIIAKVRYDDECGNGHNTFSVTGERYERHAQRGEPTVKHPDNKTLWLSSCGCIHDDIAEHFPDLAPLIKWHLVSSDGPMHYAGNVVYLAGDKDCWGLRKGEVRQIVSGRSKLPSWHLVAIDENGAEVPTYKLPGSVDAAECPPCKHRLEWRPWCRIGEGKARELDAARRAAVWSDATDEELTAPGLEERLAARLPALMAEFRAAVESLGFTF